MSIPADNGGFLKRRVKPVSVQASQQETGYEIDHAFTLIPSQVFESGTLTANLTIDMDFGAQTSFLGFALINHNIPDTATITFYYSSTGFTPPFDAFDVMTWHEKNIYMFCDRSYRYVRIEIAAVGSSIRIGVIYPALERFQFPHNYSWGYKREFVVAKVVTTSDYGVHFEEPNEESAVTAPEFEKLWLTFDDVKDQYYESYKDLIRVGKKVYIPAFTAGLCFYGIVPNTKLTSVSAREGDTYSLDFFEDAHGETQ